MIHAEKRTGHAAGDHADPLEGPSAEPRAEHPADRPRRAGQAPAGRRLAPGRGVRTDHGPARSRRTQPVVASAGRNDPAGALDRARESALGAVSCFPACTRPVPRPLADGASERPRRGPLGLRAGTVQRARRRRPGLARSRQLQPYETTATGRAGERRNGFSLPSGERARRVLAVRAAPAAGARRAARHPDIHTQVPRQPSAAAHVDPLIGFCERCGSCCRS